jgi:hypothetical protein
MANTQTINPNAIITNVVANPKRGVSRLRFACYKNGQTVAQYQKAVAALVKAGKVPKNYALADIKWDTARGFITLGAPKPAKGAKKGKGGVTVAKKA